MRLPESFPALLQKAAQHSMAFIAHVPGPPLLRRCYMRVYMGVRAHCVQCTQPHLPPPTTHTTFNFGFGARCFCHEITRASNSARAHVVLLSLRGGNDERARDLGSNRMLRILHGKTT